MGNRRHGISLKHGGRSAMEYVKILRNDPCVYCGEPTENVEHILPRSLCKFPEFRVCLSVGSGQDGWPNLAGACAKCNQERRSKGLLVYLMERKDGIPTHK